MKNTSEKEKRRVFRIKTLRDGKIHKFYGTSRECMHWLYKEFKSIDTNSMVLL